MASTWKSKSETAFAVTLLCGMFALETRVANRVYPNRFAWLVWTLLGVAAAGSLAYGVWCRRMARAQRAAEQAKTAPD